jgi:GntR family transcriptional repressor for pyruvate dehydrogenase complex
MSADIAADMESTPAAKAGAKRPSRVEVVLEYVKDGIIPGRFKAESKLPTENEIADELGLSRTPVREAMKVLEALGMLEIRAGAGTFVRASLEPSLAQLMLFRLYVKTASIEKLVEVRRIVELGCAELAAKRRTPEDLARMQECIDTLAACAASPTPDIERTLQADLGFHRAMFAATHNELINTIANFVLDMVSPWIGQSLEAGGAERAVMWHRVWYAMIEAKDSEPMRSTFSFPQVDLGMDYFRKSLEPDGP